MARFLLSSCHKATESYSTWRLEATTPMVSFQLNMRVGSKTMKRVLIAESLLPCVVIKLAGFTSQTPLVSLASVCVEEHAIPASQFAMRQETEKQHLDLALEGHAVCNHSYGSRCINAILSPLLIANRRTCYL